MRFSSKRNLLITALVVALFGAMGVQAQVGTTSLRGTVTDKSGAAIVGAKVTLASSAQALQRETQTNQTGEYEFLALPPGTYSLTFEMTSFRKFEQKNLQLLVNTPTTVNVTLQVGTASETVEVSAQAVTLNTTDASLGIAFNENQVRQLPLEGRNVPDLLSLQAGVVYTSNRPDAPVDTDTRSGAVNGARSDQSNVTLDGVPVNDAGGHAFTSVLPVTLDSVQEFRTTTSNYNADQGGSSGAQVAMVYKSGTDQFHGSLYEYNRNTYTEANDFFVKQAQQSTCASNGYNLNSYKCNAPPRLIRNVFGGSVGGPVLKKRFYFFLNYEGQRRSEQQSAVREVPTDALRAGYIQYLCADTNNDGSNTDECPGGQQIPLTTTSKKSYTYTVPAGYMALSPAQITQMDPLKLGPNPAVLTYFQQYQSPNDTSVGDGLNFSGFRFAAPIRDTVNWYIAKLDYNITSDGKHRLSLSGAMTNEVSPQAPLLPGGAPENTSLNFNKGIIANYSGVISNALVNNFRYGFVRQSYGNIGDSNDPWIFIRSLDQGITRSSVSKTPAHTYSDDLSWSHGTHTLQFGTMLGFTSNPRNNTSNSFSDGVANASWLDVSGMLVKNSAFNPALNPSGAGPCNPTTGVGCYPAGDGSFANAYDFPLMGLLGMVTEVDATYNYLKDGTVLPQKTPVSRHFAYRSYAWYGQDSWKIKPNLTVTYGLRYQIEPAPWETNGLQVTTTDASGKPLPLAQWFGQRGANMANGIPSNQDPLVSFSLGGPANGKPGLYHTDYHNFAPRLAIAWSPKGQEGLAKSLFGGGGKTTIRAGFGVAYDSIRSGLLDTFDTRGSFGLASTLSNPAGIEAANCAPRLTDMNMIPTKDLGCAKDTPANVPAQIFIPAPAGQFPQTFPNQLTNGGFCICWGIDDGLKTPYSYALDFSVGRQLPGGFSLEVSYVGRLAHRLLAQQDMAMPLDLFDKKSGLDYFKAITALAKDYRQQLASGNNTPSVSFNPSSMPANVQQYWTDMLQPFLSGDSYAMSSCTGTDPTTGKAIIVPTQSATAAIYDLFCGFNKNETTGLFVLDYFGVSGTQLCTDNLGNTFPCNSYVPAGGTNSFFNSQFSSLYGWRSNSNANYHAMQANFRHAMTHGVQFDFNYTFSKSIDIFSDATRVGAWGGLGGQMINAWNPNQMRAVSDYDTRHQFNANWIAELPFGKGKPLARNANGFVDAIIGGWQLSGVYRMTSGFPVNISNGFQWPTNWQLSGNGFLTSPLKTGAFPINSGSDAGNINLFANGPAAINAFRNPFPGEGGARNQIRGQGYFGLDAGLAKRWKMPYSEKHSLQFRWEVFNVVNAKRFDVQSLPLTSSGELDISSTFGNYSRLLTNPRVMQFALRYEF